MKDKLTFPSFTHDSIAGYCNDKPLWAQYRDDKKSKYIGTKQLWQELTKTKQALDVAVMALKEFDKNNIDYGPAFEALHIIKQITESPAENVQPDTKSRPVNVQKIDIGELAYLQKENSNLKDELERTRKALDVAKKRLKNIILDVEVLATPEYLASRAKETLDRIKQITETKDVK